MFDVQKDELRRLGDGDLRELVARLCRAELALLGAPVSAVKWGGAQNAPDGGLDIDVQVGNQDFMGDFVPCARTGIQVKKPKMPPSRIAREMVRDGKLRSIFASLNSDKGCYVIVSLEDDPSSSELTNRIWEMESRINAANLDDLQVRFYGRNDVASWLDRHVGVQLWARRKLNLSLVGWRPFERWTATPPDADDGLICEAGVVIRLPGREQDEIGIAEGIERIRELVRNSGDAVRIVGLSGVGKSRIVQALFERDIGTRPLDDSLAVYADVGEDPEPSAWEVVENLGASRQPAVVVLDNCSSERHNQIAGRVARWPKLSLLTIEYDIREDRPEGTSVVRIEARNSGMAQRLVERRHPELGRENARRIAEFSEGNARVALMLAGVVDEKETLSSFSNPQLFERLFHQRRGHDKDLLKAAEALALVYSFSVADAEEGVDELGTLAELLGEDRLELYRQAQALVDRQLAQRRGRWRAVLPQVVGNWLAARALSNVPVGRIVSTFERLPSRRLLKSFGRRLGHLHDHEHARDIVQTWLGEAGRLHALSALDNDDWQLLEHVAPVHPEGVLSIVERQDSAFLSARRNPYWHVFVGLVAKIAYDPRFFERAVILLGRVLLSEEEGVFWDSVRNRLFGLFQVNLSGTHASPAIRERLIRRFLSGGRREEQGLGLGMLKAALKSHYLTSSGDTDFGARPRDYGYRPKTWDETVEWFERFVLLAQETAVSGDDYLSTEIRTLLGQELRSLWRFEELRETLVHSGKSLGQCGGWTEGLRAVRLINRYDRRQASDGTVEYGGELLDELEEFLEPKGLAGQVRTYVLSPQDWTWSLDDQLDLHDDERWDRARERASARAYGLGTLAAAEPEVLDELSKELFTMPGRPATIDFGRGLASRRKNLRALWDRLVAFLSLAGLEARDCGVLEGVFGVVHERDASLAQGILDEAVRDRVLRRYIVGLQLSIPVGSFRLRRLLQSLDFEDIEVRQFEYANWYLVAEQVGEPEVVDLMLKLLDKPGAVEIVLRILSNWLSQLKKNEHVPTRDLRRVGLLTSAKLLQGTTMEYDGGVTDFHLSAVLEICFPEDDLRAEAEEVWVAYFDRVRTSHLEMWKLEVSSAVLARKGTFRFLDGIFSEPGMTDSQRQWYFREGIRSKSPLSGVRAQVLMDWCRQGGFQDRLQMVSQAIYPFEKSGDDKLVLSQQALTIIEESQDPSAALRNLAWYAYNPRGHSGSEVIAKRCDAFRPLLSHGRSEVRDAVEGQIGAMEERVMWERERELHMAGRPEARFE